MRKMEKESDRQTADKHSHDRIELRSEKVRKIIGDVPNGLVRYGNLVILIIFILLIAAVSMLPFPYSHGETILQHILNI